MVTFPVNFFHPIDSQFHLPFDHKTPLLSMGMLGDLPNWFYIKEYDLFPYPLKKPPLHPSEWNVRFRQIGNHLRIKFIGHITLHWARYRVPRYSNFFPSIHNRKGV